MASNEDDHVIFAKAGCSYHEMRKTIYSILISVVTKYLFVFSIHIVFLLSYGYKIVMRTFLLSFEGCLCSIMIYDLM